MKNERRQRYENRPAGSSRRCCWRRSTRPTTRTTTRSSARWRTCRGVGRRRQGVLPHLLRARATRRWSSRATSIAPRPSSWSSSTSGRSRAGDADHAAARARGPADARQADRDGGEDPAAAALRRVPDAGELRARRSRAGSCSANVLGGGKSSRLYKRLVYEMKIAQSVTAAQQSQLLPASFEITASPMPGHTLDEILAVIDEEIAGAAGQAGRRGGAGPGQEPARVGHGAQPREPAGPRRAAAVLQLPASAIPAS